MKFLIALFCVALVVAVPVAEVPQKTAPETKVETPAPVAATETKTEAPVAAATTETKTEAPVAAAATETKTEAPVAATETKTETPVAAATTETKTEAPVAATTETKTETPAAATTETKTETPKVEEPKTAEPLTEIVKVVQQLAADEDHKNLLALMQSGMDIIAEAEKKANDIQSKLETQTLIQGDNFLGVKSDGSIDSTAAVNQITSLLDVFVGPNTISDKDKEMLHNMIDAVSQIVTPMINQNPANGIVLPPPEAVDNLVKLLVPPTEQASALASIHSIEKVAQMFLSTATSSKADLLHPETLLQVEGGESNEAMDALSQLANVFIQAFAEPEEVEQN